MNAQYRWMFLLFASCVFYMAFIPAYIVVLFVTILIDYIAGIKIEATQGKKRLSWLIFSILSTCLVLFVFKYFNFFASNINFITRFFGIPYSTKTLDIILPIGLSFHTFQSLSYVIEVYRGNQKAEHHFGIYSLYVMFYPQLVAGPIERPQNLFWQFRINHTFRYQNVTEGLKRMTWGFFKKVVIADRLAAIVGSVYSSPESFSSISLIIATVFFAFQIYCDFSGYSDIALGSAQVMGFKLMENFRSPYLSKSVSEFWRRWHISLSTWFKDYLYISLGGNRVSAPRMHFNLLTTFLVSGFWHGANWTFVIWGGLNGVYLIIEQELRSDKYSIIKKLNLSRFPAGLTFFQTLFTFILISISWVFFRAESVEEAFLIIKRMFFDHFSKIPFIKLGMRETTLSFVLILFLLLVEYGTQKEPIWSLLQKRPTWQRWSVYYAMVAGIILLGVFKENQFIYFQF